MRAMITSICKTQLPLMPLNLTSHTPPHSTSKLHLELFTRPDPLAIKPKENRHRDERQANEPQQTVPPPKAQRVVHR